MTTAGIPLWQQRFRAPRIGFPRWAQDAPDRCLYSSNAGGTFEFYAWDRASDSHARLTNRPAGTMFGELGPDGGTVWWFDDSAGDELGRWMRQPFDACSGAGSASAAVPAVADLEPGYPVGLRLGRTVAAIGLSTRAGVAVYLHRYGATGPTPVVYRAVRHARVTALSYDETLLAIDHSEHGDADHPALRVLRIDAPDGSVSVAGELADGPGRGLRAIDFAPSKGDARLLVRHERAGRGELLIWDLASGDVTELPIDLSGELSGRWYPDGRTLLVHRQWQARSELYRYELASGSLTRTEKPAGVVHGYGVRPDGSVEFLSTSAEQPAVVLADDGRQVLAAEPAAPGSVPLTDVWVEGPAGPIHAMVARPSEADGPLPMLVWLHGGPGGQMTDDFFPIRAAFVDAGYVVVHVNYRGSSGYGTTWQDADRAAPGLVELEDVAAVRDWAVDSGLALADRCVITGKSWGGYLTLLALGTQPERWAAGIADVPIGDMVALYEDEMEPVREGDRSLFGGTPDELPDKWARSSPITYADQVRAPLLVIAARNDPRCPYRQVRNYLARLNELGIAYEVELFDSGHLGLVTDESVHQLALQLDFLARYVPTTSA